MLNPALLMRIEADQDELAALLTSVLAPKHLAAHLEGDEDQPLHGLPV